MHGFLNLKNAISEFEFKIAFDDFGNHLKERRLITSFRFMQRSSDENYDSNPPTTTYYIHMDFEDLAHTQKCWYYIEANNSQSTHLHQTVYSKIDDYSFFLSEDVPAYQIHSMEIQVLKLPNNHLTVTNSFVAECHEDDRVVAAFLGSSYTLDPANLDLYLITTDEAYEDFLAGRGAFL